MSTVIVLLRMCLAIPGKLIELKEVQGIRMGKANFGGIVKQICLEYTPEARIDDYILVHVGFALAIIDEAEAERTYELLKQLDQLSELDVPEVETQKCGGDEGIAFMSTITLDAPPPIECRPRE